MKTNARTFPSSYMPHAEKTGSQLLMPFFLRALVMAPIQLAAAICLLTAAVGYGVHASKPQPAQALLEECFNSQQQMHTSQRTFASQIQQRAKSDRQACRVATLKGHLQSETARWATNYP